MQSGSRESSLEALEAVCAKDDSDLDHGARGRDSKWSDSDRFWQQNQYDLLISYGRQEKKKVGPSR